MIRLVMLALLLAACTFHHYVDTNRLEKAIRSQVLRQAHVSVSVRCPDRVVARKGGRFRCTVSDGHGHVVIADVTQTDDQGDVHFEIRP